MRNSVKEFIEKNINLIENEDWKTVYVNALLKLSESSIGEFSYTMIKAGLNPLSGLDHIPEGFLYRSDITSYEIPSNILSIHADAFMACHMLE